MIELPRMSEKKETLLYGESAFSSRCQRSALTSAIWKGQRACRGQRIVMVAATRITNDRQRDG